MRAGWDDARIPFCEESLKFLDDFRVEDMFNVVGIPVDVARRDVR